MERNMDQVKKMTQHHQEPVRHLARKTYSRANSSKGGCLIPVKRKSQQVGITPTLDEPKPRQPAVVELNLKSSLMGVKIYGDKGHFFSRQSSMSPNRLSSRFIPCCSGRPWVDQQRVESSKKSISVVASSKPRPSHVDKRDSLSKLMAAESPGRSVSGVLYSSPHVGNNTDSSILNAVHFTFGDVTEKIYKQLLEQSRREGGQLQDQTSPGSKAENYSDAVSTLFCESDKYPRVSCSSSSLTFSERLFGYEFSKDSPQRPTHQPDSAIHQAAAAPACSTDQLSTLDCEEFATDGDDIILEDDIIFEVPLHTSCGHDPRHYAELVMVGPKPRVPKCERWSFNKQAFNLELEQQALKSPSSVNVNRRDQPPTEARAKLDVSRRDMMSSPSFKREPLDQQSSSFRSDRSGWLELESDMINDSDYVLDSGRLKIDVQFDQAELLIPDLDTKYVDNRHHDDVKHPDDLEYNKFHDGREDGSSAKMDEEDFPFNSPIASSFVFGEGLKKHSSLPRPVLPETDDDLDHSDAYHDPDDGSISDTDSSLTTFSLDADADQLHQSSLWVSTRSFNYLREVVDHNSGFLDIKSRSGRFSVDLRQEQRLGRVEHHQHQHHPPRPRMRFVCMKSEKRRSSSLLAPCLVCVSCWHQRAQDP